MPSHLTVGLAKADLSNVNAAAALTALGAAADDLSNVDPATGHFCLEYTSPVVTISPPFQGLTVLRETCLFNLIPLF